MTNELETPTSQATPITDGVLSVLTTFAEKALNVSISDLGILADDGSVTDNALDVLATKFSERLTSVKSEAEKAAFENGRKNGQSEAARKKEAEINALKEQLQKGFEAQDWEKHPLTLEWQNKKQAEIEQLIEQKEAEKAAILNDLKRKAIISEVEKEAFMQFDAYNPALPTKDPNKVANLKRLFVQTLTNQYDFENVNGQIVAIDKQGNVVKDNFGNAIQFKQLANREMSNLYDPIAQTPKGSAGNMPTSSAVDEPKTLSDLMSLYNGISDVSERVKLMEKYSHLMG